MSELIFLAHADEEWGRALLARLLGDGFDVHDLMVSLDPVDVMLLVATPHALQTDGILADLEAFPVEHKPLIPLIPPLVARGKLHWLPPALAQLNPIDFREDEGAAYQRLRLRLGAGQPASPPPSALPPAYLEVLDSPHRRERGRRYRLKTAQSTIGSARRNQIRLRDAAAQQCRLYYDAHDGAFYLQSSDAITTLHDQILEPDTPLALWNGDLITLSEHVVLQFRLGEMKN